jgi:hypothetical protein
MLYNARNHWVGYVEFHDGQNRQTLLFWILLLLTIIQNEVAK